MRLPESGQDAAEYAVLLAIIVVIVIVGATVLGGAITALFQALGAFLMTLP